MSVLAHLQNVMVSPGYQDAPNVKFIANTKGDTNWGSISFKVSNRKSTFADGKTTTDYDNYSVFVRGVKSDAGVIGFLNQKGTRVNVAGFLTQENFNGRPYIKIAVEGSRFIDVTKFGEGSNSNTDAPAVPAQAEDDLPF